MAKLWDVDLRGDEPSVVIEVFGVGARIRFHPNDKEFVEDLKKLASALETYQAGLKEMAANG